MNNPPPAPAIPEPPVITERIIETVTVIERPVVQMEPFSFRLWWQRLRKAKQDKKVSKEISQGIRPHGRTKGFGNAEVPVEGRLSLKLFKKGESQE